MLKRKAASSAAGSEAGSGDGGKDGVGEGVERLLTAAMLGERAPQATWHAGLGTSG